MSKFDSNTNPFSDSDPDKQRWVYKWGITGISSLAIVGLGVAFYFVIHSSRGW